jgi:hypothetical protein
VNYEALHLGEKWTNGAVLANQRLDFFLTASSQVLEVFLKSNEINGRFTARHF